jgi:methylenetetrahydrofolate reductase (NADPH)
VGVAAHPELHPRSEDRASDRRHLAAKLAVADFAVTQFFFDVDDYARMIDELAELGCDKPVLPGVMPVINVAGVKRMTAMNGTVIPPPLLERLDRADGDPAEVAAIGVEVATELVQELLELGVPGIHLYAMNRSSSVRRIYENLGRAT